MKLQLHRGRNLNSLKAADLVNAMKVK